MQGHRSNRHGNPVFNPMYSVPNPIYSMPDPTENCQRFRFMHPFTCMVAGTTRSGKTARVKSLLQQAQEIVHLPPERTVWCYSQLQPAFMELMVTVPNIEFVKGIPSELENDSFFDINKRNLVVIDHQMENAGGDKQPQRNLSVIYIVQSLLHQGKNSPRFLYLDTYLDLPRPNSTLT